MTGRRLLGLSSLVFGFDQATKIAVVDGLNLAERLRVEVWPGVVTFKMGWNRGVNFGLFDMGDAGRWFLVGLALAIVAGLALWVRRSQGWATAIGVGAIIGGALGNVWDRLQYGAVADFINMSCCGIRNPFAFNVADAAIFGGVAVLVLFARAPDRDKAPEPRNRT